MRGSARALAALCLVATAAAAHAETAQRIDVPAGRLGVTIGLLGRQAGVSIGVSDPALAAVRTRAVRGALTPRQALDRMLRGTPATYVSLGEAGWRIVRRPQQASPAPSASSAPPTEEPEEIVVMASKREARLQTYPASVTVLRLADLPVDASGGGSELLVSRLPGVTSTHLGPGRNKLFIRGLADSSFNGPTQATVGQYLGEARLNYNAPDPDLRLYDISRIEVLQGPQGTLHGVGSLGGVLRILPAAPDPDSFGGHASASVSTTAHGEPGFDAAAALNLPIAPGSAGLRLVGYHVRDGGYIDDSLRQLGDVNRVETSGGRASLRIEPGGGWSIDLGGAWQAIDGRDSQYADRDAPDLSKSSPVAESFDNRFGLGQLVVRKQWDDGLSLVSATSFARQTLAETYDASQPGAPTSFHQRGEIDFFANENRIARRDERFGWVIGTSLAHNRYRLRRDFAPLTFARPIGGVANRIEEATLFGEASVGLSPNVTVAAGGRFSALRLSGSALDAVTLALARDAQMKASRTETSFLPSLAVSVTAAEDLTLYARYQESFRPGGIVVRDEFIQRYRNDDVTSIEAGLRYGAPGQGAFDAVAAIAYTRWRDIQADQIDAVGLPTTINIGDGRIWTLDARLGWRPLPGLEIEASGVLADSELTNPAPSTIIVVNSELPNVAHLNARLGVDYATALGDDLDLRLSGWARYVGKSRLGVGPILGEAQGDYLDTGLGARLVRGDAALLVSVTNILDTIGNRFALGSPFTLAHEGQITPLRPRTVRVGVEVAF